MLFPALNYLSCAQIAAYEGGPFFIFFHVGSLLSRCQKELFDLFYPPLSFVDDRRAFGTENRVK